MGKKHELLQDAKTYKLGKKLTVTDVLLQYVLPELKSKKRRLSTTTSLQREVSRFNNWWATIDSGSLPVVRIRRKHLETYRQWLSDEGHSVPLQNGSVRAVMQILNAAARHELITHSPKLESIHHRGIAPKVFPSNEEVCRIWEATSIAKWPRRTSSLEKLSYSPQTMWKVAIVLYWTYGFRTQELVQLEEGYRALRWSNLYAPGITPNPEGKCECEHGWIGYVPQKQERVKNDLLCVPLNQYTKAAIDLVAPETRDPACKVLDVSMSAISFRKQWDTICNEAKVFPRLGSGVKKFTIKHLRKAATTNANNHMPGTGEHIVGHSSDRSGQSSVSMNHYDIPEQRVLDCVLTMPVPECFKELTE